jgi:hypothetical protein
MTVAAIWLPGEPSLQESILFSKKRDHVGLLTIEPAAHDRSATGTGARPSLRHRGRSSSGTLQVVIHCVTLFSSRLTDVDHAVSLRSESLDLEVRQSDNRRIMTEFRIAIRQRLRRVRAVAGVHFAVMIVAGAPAFAQTQSPTPLQELEARLTELREAVDQLKKEATVSSQIDRISTQVDSLKKQLDKVKAPNQETNQISRAPTAVWWTLGSIGSLFVIAWWGVSGRRETTRQAEAAQEATLKQLKAIEEGASERVKLIVELLRAIQKTQGSPMTVSETVKRAIELADALTAIFRRGLQQSRP